MSGAAANHSAARPRLGFLGVGWIGANRLAAIAGSGLGDVIAIADSSPSAIATTRAIVPAAAVGASLDDLLAHDLDGVVIATPSGLHAAHSLAALDRQVAVFCQKPLARTSVEASRIVEAARASNRLLGVDLSYRHLAGARAIRQAVQEGHIGDVFAIDLVFHNAYGPNAGWAHDPQLSGGGCVIDLGVHLIDLALWVLDFPRVLTATGRLYANGRCLSPNESVVEDFAVASLTLESGAAVSMTCSWHAHAGQDARIEVEFHGSRGSARLANVSGSFHDFAAELRFGTRRQPLGFDAEGWGGAASVSWLERLCDGARFDGSASQYVDVAATLDRIYGR
jgi:predicted dehydrogenase